MFSQEGSKLACGRESDRRQSARANFYDRRQRPEYLVHPGRSFPPLHSAHVSGDAISVFSVCTSPMHISVLANELLTHRGASLSSLGLLVNPHSRPLSTAAAQHVHKALQPHGHYGRDDGGSLLLRREKGGRQDVVDGKDQPLVHTRRPLGALSPRRGGWKIPTSGLHRTRRPLAVWCFDVSPLHAL